MGMLRLQLRVCFAPLNSQEALEGLIAHEADCILGYHLGCMNMPNTQLLTDIPIEGLMIMSSRAMLLSLTLRG